MAAIAAQTSSIRLGSAGVMLPHYAPLKVAEQFRVLDALAPGRIDLGVGRAPGADMRTAQLLNPNAYAAAEHFPQQIVDLVNQATAGEELPASAPAGAPVAAPVAAQSASTPALDSAVARARRLVNEGAGPT